MALPAHEQQWQTAAAHEQQWQPAAADSSQSVGGHSTHVGVCDGQISEVLYARQHAPLEEARALAEQCTRHVGGARHDQLVELEARAGRDAGGCGGGCSFRGFRCSVLGCAARSATTHGIVATQLVAATAPRGTRRLDVHAHGRGPSGVAAAFNRRDLGGEAEFARLAGCD